SRQSDRTPGADGTGDPRAPRRGGTKDPPPLRPRHSRLMSGRIAVGVIRKPHGVRGEASVEPWTNSPERFDDLTTVTLVSPDEASTREMRIESVRVHAGRALVKFE